MKEITKKLKDYAVKKELSGLDIPDQEELSEIKISYYKFAKQFVVYFAHFDKEFKDSLSNDEMKKFIGKLNEVSEELRNILNEMEDATHYGKDVWMKDLKEIVSSNYNLMNEFLDDYIEIFGNNKKNELSEVIKKLSKKEGKDGIQKEE